MISFSAKILIAAALGATAAFLAVAVPPPPDPCDSALNPTPARRRDFPGLALFHDDWVKRLTSASAREHGWRLYQGVVAPAGDGCSSSDVPLWLSWLTKAEVFAAPPSDPSKTNGRQIVATASSTLGQAQTLEQRLHALVNKRFAAVQGLLNSQLPADLTLFVMPGNQNARIIFSTVHYNPAAANSNLNAVPDKMIVAHQKPGGQVEDPTPETAIIVKPIWYPIVPETTGACLPIWNPNDPRLAGSELGAYPPENWPRQVRVSSADKPTRTAPCLIGSELKEVPVVSVREFFSMKLTPLGPANQAALQVILSRNTRLAGAVQSGNQVLLVGFHVISKELRTWSWNTYWWEPAEYRTGVLADRPMKMGQPWDNYVMNSTLDEAHIPPSLVARKCNVGAIYNPYQEAALQNDSPEAEAVCGQTGKTLGGLASNCRSCHSLAAYPSDGKPLVTLQTPADYFKDRTRTGFLWSLPLYLNR
jgi:hypothetical protein